MSRAVKQMEANQTETLENYCTNTVLNVDKLEKKLNGVAARVNVWVELGKGTRSCGCQCPTGSINMHITYNSFSTCVIFKIKFFC